ncbi:MAG: HlyC/CorC family transporter, partial [Chloroflexi bacterium]|nr:HlyC/CorC family transporter [Chloroflexota bacterium]
VMKPRSQIVYLTTRRAPQQNLAIARESLYTRFPVCDPDLDHVVGYAHIRDLLDTPPDGHDAGLLLRVRRTVPFVPEAAPLDEVLQQLRADKSHIAIVVDEYGGTAGILTLEDLVEEIVGEIQDEYDTEEGRLERMSESEAVCDARVSIHDVNEALHLSLEEEGEYDTVGGLVYDRLGKIPVVGDEVQVDGLSVTVLSTAGKRIKKVKILARSPEPDPS